MNKVSNKRTKQNIKKLEVYLSKKIKNEFSRNKATDISKDR